MSDIDWVSLVATGSAQAHMLKDLLEEQGIAAHVAGSGVSVLGDFPHGTPGHDDAAPSVLVPASQLEAARQVLDQVRNRLAEGLSSPELSRLEEAHGDDDGWPTCPHCDRPRLTRCPVCDTSGAHFARAFMPEACHCNPADECEQSEPSLVICPTCDEPFQPEYLSRCEWCGHRFGDGVAPPQIALYQPPPFALAEFGLRAAIVLVGLVATMAAMGGWFYYVLR